MQSLKLLFAFCVLTLSTPAFAQDASQDASVAGSPATTETTTGAPLGVPPMDEASITKRAEIAKKIHDLRPTREQVYAAIDQAAQTQPPEEQESFRSAMRNVLNYQAIEKISIDAMVEVYTEAELQVMYDFYSKAEAKTAGAKDDLYAGKVYPEIMRMLDEAMMRVRTGTSTPSASPAVAQ
jgi:hypothetical protein